MAKRIVINETGSRQSKKSEIAHNLNFTELQWQKFSRLLTDGCGMCHNLITLDKGQTTFVDAKHEYSWRKNSRELSHMIEVLRDGKLKFKKVIDEDSSD